MIGKLKSKNVRTVHSQKVVRLQIDVPYQQMEEKEGVDMDMLSWLDNNVGTEVSFRLGAFDGEEQGTLIDEGGDDEYEEFVPDGRSKF